MMTTALASVGQIRWSGEARSEADPIHCVAGQTMIATRAAITARRIPAPAQLDRAHPREFGAALWLERSLGQMADRLAAQGVSGLNSQGVERPEIRFRRAKQRPPADPTHAGDSQKDNRGADAVQFQQSGQDVADPCRRDQGARPRIAAGSTIDATQAIRSLVRLISARRLPAIASSDFCLGLDASSSASPSRGSSRRLAGSRPGRCGPDSALEGITAGARMASGGEFFRARPAIACGASLR